MKQFFEQYGGVALGILALLVLIAMITPVGNIIKTSLQGTVQTFSVRIEEQQTDTTNIDMKRFSFVSPTNLLEKGSGAIYSTAYGTYTYDDEIDYYSITKTRDTDSNKFPTGLTFHPSVKTGHKYFLIYDFKLSESKTVYYELSNNDFDEVTPYDVSWGWVTNMNTITVSSDFTGSLIIKPFMSIGAIAEYKNVRFYDLTEIYGAGNEPNDYEQIKQDLFL